MHPAACPPTRLRPGLRRRGRADERACWDSCRSAVWPGQQHAARRLGLGYLAALLCACGRTDARAPRRGTAAAPPGLAEPLTDRELEVLRLLAAGWSNQRVARDLVVALDRVKRP
jgi:hypothetical protein